MEIRKTPKLNEVFPDWTTGGGIFSTLQNFPVPWSDPDISAALDIDYHGGHSGRKYISPLVSAVMSGDTLTEEEKTMLATSAMAVYGVSWSKEYATLSAQYDPIENYSMTEQMTNDRKVTEYGRTHTRTDDLEHTKTGTETQSPNTTETRTDNLQHGKTGTETQTPNTTETRTDNLTHGKTGTETQAPNTTETRTPNLSRNVSNNVYGFNSSTASPADSQQETQSGTEQVARTGTDTLTHNTSETQTGTQKTERTGSDTLTHNINETQTGTQQVQRTGQETLTHNVTDTDTGTQTDRDSGEDTETRNYTLTRSGNIGVTTSQQMLQSERDIWLWNFFRDVVYPDIDRLLSLAVY